MLSPTALFAYKCSEFYLPDQEGGVSWNDPDLGIDWPVENPILSEKDRRYSPLHEIPPEKLPRYTGEPE